jgi:hypothetical protein
VHFSADIFIAAVGVLLTAATVWGAFRVSRNTTATALYRGTAEAWEARAGIQATEIRETREQAERDRVEFTRRLAGKDAQIADLNARVQLLTDMVTGKSVLEEISRALQQRFDERAEEILDIVRTARDEVAAMRKAVETPKAAA